MIIIGSLAISMFPLRLFCFSGPVCNAEPLPAAKFIDWHCHIAGLGFGESGCFVSEKLKNSFKFSIYLKALGVTLNDLKEQGDSVVIKRLSKNLKESRYISKALILALDGKIKEGELDTRNSEFYVPNEYVLNEVKKYDNLLFGASINPYRKNALERLDWAKKNGALCIKWIPSIMDIDPSDKSIISFYKKMKELKIPLLIHSGKERSFTDSNDELCDPLKLILPLECGVTVIAAHIATTGKNEGEENFERILPLFKKYPNLYADISSLTQINKLGFLNKALLNGSLKGRLIYGTDWPLQFFPLVSPFYHYKNLTISQMIKIGFIPNKWDMDIILKQSLGVPREIFTKGEEIYIK